MIQEGFVTLETAKLLKEKGFKEDVFTFYEVDCVEGDMILSETYNESENFNEKNDCLSAPTQSLAQKWLCETKNIHVFSIPRIIDSYNKIGEVVKTIVEFYYWEIYVVGSSPKYIAQNCLSNQFNTYEEALEAGLQEALKLI